MDVIQALSLLPPSQNQNSNPIPSTPVVSRNQYNQQSKYNRYNSYNKEYSQQKTYAHTEKNFDNISDPTPFPNKEERPLGTLIEDYGATLSQEQKSVFEFILKGYNVFFTGDAGTGKSYLLRCVIEALQEQVGKEKVFVTASTGIAACNIGGITLHAFAGLGISDLSISNTIRKVRQNEGAVDRWLACQVLIIDEISMLDGQLFDTLEYVARVIRNKDYPFGGIQVICCGDFFQLPPVGLGKNGVTYCFESRWWRSVIEKTLIMRQVFRQKDTQLQQLLREVRYGRISPQSMQFIRRMEQTTLGSARPIPCSDDDEVFAIESTKLFAHNRHVDQYNQQKLDALLSPAVEFVCEDTGDHASFLSQLNSHCQAPSRLVLKRGAQVMLLKNLSVADGLVNGCRGVVTSFRTRGDKISVPLVTFATVKGETEVAVEAQDFTMEAGGLVVAKRHQIPLKLAWGISIHKSQGMTIDLLEVDLSGVFEAGMSYVALSRGVSMDRMRVTGFTLDGLKTSPKVVAFYSCIIQGKEFIPFKQKEGGKSQNRGKQSAYFGKTDSHVPTAKKTMQIQHTNRNADNTLMQLVAGLQKLNRS